MEKLIITCAPTGSLTIPTQTLYLPFKPVDIADEAIRAAEAGAAIVHIHARDPENGKPTPDLEVFEKIITRIKQSSNVIIGLTTGGAPGMTPEERIIVVPRFKPELASFNMGPVCLNIAPIAKRFNDDDYKYSWEKDFLRKTSGMIMHNTYDTLDIFLKTMEENGTKSECECYDAGHLFNVGYYYRKGAIKRPVWIQFVTGGLGTIGGSPEDIIYLKQTADRLLGDGNYCWSFINAGGTVFQNAPTAIAMGGHVRVGFEDNIFIERGIMAKSNAELVEKMVRIAREMGREIATPEEARDILKLKGNQQVNF